MRQHRYRLVVLTLLTTVASACGGGNAASDGLTANLTTIETVVESRTGQETAFTATLADQNAVPLGVGDEARTDATGFAQITYPDGSLTRIADGAHFVVNALSAVEDAQVTEVGVDVGRAWNRVQKVSGSEGRFEVDAGIATAAVRGTGFDVECTETCLFTVLEGAVEVQTSTGVTVELAAGQAVEVAANGDAGPLLAIALPLDPWFRDNLDRDEAAGFPVVADPPEAAASPGIGGSWAVAFTVTDSNDPQAPVGATNQAQWDVTMSCPSGPCDGTITTTDVPVAGFTFADGVYVVDEADQQTTIACRDAGVVAYDRASTGQLSATHAAADDPAQGVRFAGVLTEVLTPRADAVANGCVADTVISRTTSFRARQV